MQETKVESSIQIREIKGLQDDHSPSYTDTKVNINKMLRYIKLCDDIKPNGYTKLQLWRITITRIEND